MIGIPSMQCTPYPLGNLQLKGRWANEQKSDNSYLSAKDYERVYLVLFCRGISLVIRIFYWRKAKDIKNNSHCWGGVVSLPFLSTLYNNNVVSSLLVEKIASRSTSSICRDVDQVYAPFKDKVPLLSFSSPHQSPRRERSCRVASDTGACSVQHLIYFEFILFGYPPLWSNLSFHFI